MIRFISIICIIMGIIIHLMITTVNADKCRFNNVTLECPREGELFYFTRCCMIQENSTDLYCCEDESLLMDKLEKQKIMILSMNVIIFCFVLSVITIVCCFCDDCPLSDKCGIDYSQRGVIAYVKEEEALNQPPNENEYCQKYKPVQVKIRPVEEV